MTREEKNENLNTFSVIVTDLAVTFDMGLEFTTMIAKGGANNQNIRIMTEEIKIKARDWEKLLSFTQHRSTRLPSGRDGSLTITTIRGDIAPSTVRTSGSIRRCSRLSECLKNSSGTSHYGKTLPMPICVTFS